MFTVTTAMFQSEPRVSLRNAVFTIDFIALLVFCWLGFESLKLDPFSIVVSFAAAIFSVACAIGAYFLHSRFPKKHTEAADFPKLMTTGPYSRVRNPFYSIVIALNYGVSFIVLSYYAIIASSFMLPLWWYLVKSEEKDLEKVWGQEYIDYKKSTPMFIPKLKAPRKTLKS